MQIAYKMENKNNHANILVQLDYEIVFENMGRLDIKDFFFKWGEKSKMILLKVLCKPQNVKTVITFSSLLDLNTNLPIQRLFI